MAQFDCFDYQVLSLRLGFGDGAFWPRVERLAFFDAQVFQPRIKEPITVSHRFTLN